MVMDGCGVRGQCGGHITEVSGWVTGWRVGMNIQRGRSWRGSARPGTGSACLPLHFQGLAQFLAHKCSANIC